VVFEAPHRAQGRRAVRHGADAGRARGDIVREHFVVFGADEEILTLSHSARDRRMFAGGAVAAPSGSRVRIQQNAKPSSR
jgi:dihydrodipicolinate reductase